MFSKGIVSKKYYCRSYGEGHHDDYHDLSMVSQNSLGKGDRSLLITFKEWRKRRRQKRLLVSMLNELKSVGFETIAKSKRFDDLVECYNYWIDTIPQLSDTAPSILDMRWIMFLHREFEQAIISTMCGSYLDAMRTLRFIFELLVQSYALECRFKDLEANERYNRVLEGLEQMRKERRSFRSNFIDEMLGFTEMEKRKLRELYDRLSDFTHPSITHFELELPPTFAFDLRALELCVTSMVDVTDLMTAMALERTPEASEKAGIYFRKTAEELGMQMTVGRLRR